jgi:hypothetical protein
LPMYQSQRKPLPKTGLPGASPERISVSDRLYGLFTSPLVPCRLSPVMTSFKGPSVPARRNPNACPVAVSVAGRPLFPDVGKRTYKSVPIIRLIERMGTAQACGLRAYPQEASGATPHGGFSLSYPGGTPEQGASASVGALFCMFSASERETASKNLLTAQTKSAVVTKTTKAASSGITVEYPQPR